MKITFEFNFDTEENQLKSLKFVEKYINDYVDKLPYIVDYDKKVENDKLIVKFVISKNSISGRRILKNMAEEVEKIGEKESIEFICKYEKFDCKKIDKDVVRKAIENIRGQKRKIIIDLVDC